MVVSARRRHAIERNLKDCGSGFSTPSSQESITISHERAQTQAIHVPAQRAVGVRDDHQREAALLERGQRRPDFVGHQLPQIVGLMVGVELGEGRRGLRRSRNAGLLENQIEEQPAAARIRRRRDRAAVVELSSRVWLRLRKRRRGGGHSLPRQCFRDAMPVGEDEDAASVEKDSLQHVSMIAGRRSRFAAGAHDLQNEQQEDEPFERAKADGQRTRAAGHAPTSHGSVAAPSDPIATIGPAIRVGNPRASAATVTGKTGPSPRPQMARRPEHHFDVAGREQRARCRSPARQGRRTSPAFPSGVSARPRPRRVRQSRRPRTPMPRTPIGSSSAERPFVSRTPSPSRQSTPRSPNRARCTSRASRAASASPPACVPMTIRRAGRRRKRRQRERHGHRRDRRAHEHQRGPDAPPPVDEATMNGHIAAPKPQQRFTAPSAPAARVGDRRADVRLVSGLTKPKPSPATAIAIVPTSLVAAAPSSATRSTSVRNRWPAFVPYRRSMPPSPDRAPGQSARELDRKERSRRRIGELPSRRKPRQDGAEHRGDDAREDEAGIESDPRMRVLVRRRSIARRMRLVSVLNATSRSAAEETVESESRRR